MTESDDKTAVPDPIDPIRDMPPNYDPFRLSSALIRDKELARTCSPDVVQRLATELLKYKELGATIKELQQAIRELQQEACNRDGVPMPSERPLVDKLREQMNRMSSVLTATAEYFDTLAAEARETASNEWYSRAQRSDAREDMVAQENMARQCRDAAGYGEEPQKT
jgi:hypothetical protein